MVKRRRLADWSKRMGSWWVVRSLAIGAVASCVDYSLVWVCAVLMGVPSAVAAACGLSVGTTVNFGLNRRFAFGDSHHPLGGAALRYAAAFGALMLVHASAVGAMADRFGVPILLAKLLADVTLLLGGQLLLLRYIVFPRNKKPQPAPVRSRAAESA